MSSEFQRTKLQAMFEAFDADGNGYLEEADFVALAGRCPDGRHATEGVSLPAGRGGKTGVGELLQVQPADTLSSTSVASHSTEEA